MPSVVGILLDLSESMKYTVFGRLDKKDQKRSRSIFTVLDEFIIKEDILPDNKIFAIGFGLRYGAQTVDLIGTIKHFREKYAKSDEKPEYSELLKKVLEKLEKDSNVSLIRFVSEDKIKKKIPYHLLSLIHDAICSSDSFLANVKSLLPRFCQPDSYMSTAKELAYSLIWKKDVDIALIFEKIKDLFLQDTNLIKLLVKEEASVYKFKTAAGSIRYWFEGKKIGDEKILNVMQAIEPFIYGEKNLLMALTNSLHIFEKSEYLKFKKYLFVLSDGQPDNSNSFDAIARKLKEEKVKVASCYVSNPLITSIQTKRLYTEEGDHWLEGAKLMFRLSSTIKTHVLPHVIFEKAGWSIDTNKNETKLFLQVNHPDHIYEACTTAKKIMSSKGALLDVLGSISLSRYIKSANKLANVTNQFRESICYAHAVATVFHLALKRVLNRAKGYPPFEDIKDALVTAFGRNGANVPSVLEHFAKEYDLHYNEVDSEMAIKAIAWNRPVITIFALTDQEWKAFSDFFSSTPHGILTKNEIDITKRDTTDSYIDGGHAVVLTSVNSECFLFMNSWGEMFGDKGFFRIQNQNVFEFKFYDVYWTDNDLQQQERQAYEQHGIRTAQKLVKELRGLNSASFTCPKCKGQSPVSSFTGNFENAICPKCTNSFDCSGEGHALAMNLYLATLLD
ncbi:Hypothetical predicted protein [Mytilus galloprovincialis]|uniref:Peptidase C1A papain C-terminal domain-containing protein n=1 Tax=Mytilus galloprovincialis TaxID=29158 RepID=A0A8B6DR96_MYTGA|nr:Hypothetical predicted protein [Mytilus galloprovincialis]